jgi:S1-C subfamily serine protease
LILTRGSVAGLEAEHGKRTWIKTDAWIGPGHSGGALVDREHRLIGVPAATMGSSESLGLAVPVGLLPDEWKSRIGKDLR